LSACGSSEKAPDQPQGADADPPAEIVPMPAGGYFKLPAGLWERKVSPLGGKTPPVERVCIDDSVRERVIPLTEVRGLLSDCKVLEQSELSIFGVTYRLQCTKPKPVIVGGNTSFRNDLLNSALNIEGGGISPDDPVPGYAGVKTTRVGDCPSNMKPGDIADVSGKVVGTLGG
jgi:hypothetical protein